MTREEIVVGLDIGTTKVCTVIAQGNAMLGMPGEQAGPINVIGVGVVPSRGIKKGVVVDVEDTVAAIRDSVERAAHMAGVKVEGAVAGITGDHILSSNRRGTVTVASPQGIISRFDIERVLQAAALEIPRDREIIHSLPRDFIVDGHPGVKRPIGMAGQHLEVETHVVTGKATFLQNAVQCIERAGLNVEALVLEPIATGEAVTTPDERDMGVVLIDIGGGTSDVAVFIDGAIVYSSVLPVGGNHVTRDIAIGLRTPFEVAEKLKIERGVALPHMVPHGEMIEVMMAGNGERLRVPHSLLCEIIEARMSELFELSRDAMIQAGVKRRLAGGVILSGGGALLPGAMELGAEKFQMTTRLGFPNEIVGWSDQVANPQFSTGVGLCRFALRQRYAPGNHAAIPALASMEGRRVWGAIASEQLVPAPNIDMAASRRAANPPVQTEATYAPVVNPVSSPAISAPVAQPVAPAAAPVVTPPVTPPDVAAPWTEPEMPVATQFEQTPFDELAPPVSKAAEAVPILAAKPVTPKPAPAVLPQEDQRRDDIRGELFKREELKSQEEAPALNWWQKLLAKLREIIGFESS